MYQEEKPQKECGPYMRKKHRKPAASPRSIIQLGGMTIWAQAGQRYATSEIELLFGNTGGLYAR